MSSWREPGDYPKKQFGGGWSLGIATTDLPMDLAVWVLAFARTTMGLASQNRPRRIAAAGEGGFDRAHVAAAVEGFA